MLWEDLIADKTGRLLSDNERKGIYMSTAVAAKTEFKTILHVQYADKDLTTEDFVKRATDDWKLKNDNIDELKSLDFYVKSEENKVYYVANGNEEGSFDI